MVKKFILMSLANLTHLSFLGSAAVQNIDKIIEATKLQPHITNQTRSFLFHVGNDQGKRRRIYDKLNYLSF